MRRPGGTRLLAVGVVLFAAASAALLVAQVATARDAVQGPAMRRLESIGVTTTRLVNRLDAGVLDTLADANALDAAYVISSDLRVIADRKGAPPHAANLLRLDEDRLARAFAGTPSVGWGFEVEGERFLAGYFPLRDGRVLVLEAGERFSSVARRLRRATLALSTAGAALVGLALVAVFTALRSQRRENEAELRAARARLVSQMSAMVAHEVRNPLGIIRGGAELLRERAQASPDGTPEATKTRELIDDILEEVSRLNALTEEFLELSREGALQRTAVDLAALAREVCDGAQKRFHTRTLRFDVTAEGTVKADPAKLRQALANLVLNAVEAVHEGGRVRVETSARGGRLRIAVSDDGPGVPPELRARLFEPFATGKATGTGLGLAVARRIFERHGGALDYVPTERGARFEGWLPV